MNRLLSLIVVVLLPVAVFMENNKEDVMVNNDVLEMKTLEIPILNQESNTDVKEDKIAKVLISNNKDKSDPFYMDLEEYVIGVVAGEMPASFNMEALKAQAIASRTFAMYKMINVKNYVLSTTINDQVYLTLEQMHSKWGSDFDYYYERVKAAVLETSGQVLTYNGDIITSYYFAISNGYTEPASTVFNETRDYLVSVESLWDKEYQSYSSSKTISKNTFCTKLNIACDRIEISNINRSNTNYVRDITINGKKFTGIEVFNKLALKSTDFTITQDGENIIIKTLGFGHGVGMSQYGANEYAKQGWSYSQILKHYYTGISIKKY